MMEKIFGQDWKTTLAGLIFAGLTVAQQYIEQGVVSPWRIGIAVGIAVMGRLAGDATKKP
jgi:hypothetical protein